MEGDMFGKIIDLVGFMILLTIGFAIGSYVLS